MTTKMKAAQISKAGGDFELVERPIPNQVQEMRFGVVLTMTDLQTGIERN